MKMVIMFACAAALAGCSKQEAAPANDANMVVMEENVAAPEETVATPAAFSLNETSWTYKEDGKDIQESIDAAGNYVASSGKDHVDHGKYEMVDGKACFTSAMDKKGPECWTVSEVAIGQTMDTTSDKGGKLTVTRVAYVPVTWPPAK